MAEAEASAGSFVVPIQAACLDGHFPGNPLVPGVVLLDEALARIAAVAGLGAPVALPNVKFSAPVRPGEHVDIGYRRAEKGQIAFSCRANGAVVAAGMASFGA